MRFWCASALLCVLCSPLCSDAQEETIHLIIHGQAPASPALRYRLLPKGEDKTAGNAATLYLNSFGQALQAQARFDGHDPATTKVDIDALEDASPADLNAAEAKRYVDAFHTVIEQCEIAGRREHCEWDPALREQGYGALLPYLNTARLITNVLSIQTRLQIKNHQYDLAVDTLRVGFTLADHVNTDPVLVQALVACGIESRLMKDMEYLASEPGAPNMCWPLIDLPSAGKDRVRMMELERASLFYTDPRWKHPENLSAQQGRQLVENVSKIIDSGWGWRGAPLIVGMVADYPRAKAFLIHQGLSAEQVDSLAANSVVLAYYVGQYEERMDDVEKWAALPYWESLYRVNNSMRFDRQTNPLLLMVPAYHRALLQLALTDRKRATLAAVEAIRAYAADHGDLPPNLLGLDPPVPLDPISNQPFQYSVNGQTATISCPKVHDAMQRVYQITLARQ